MDKYSKEIIRTLALVSSLALGAIALGCCLVHRNKAKSDIEKREYKNTPIDVKPNTENIMWRDFARQR